MHIGRFFLSFNFNSKQAPFLQCFYFYAYKEHLISRGQDGSCLDATIELLHHTTQAIQLFSDRQTIKSIKDDRLEDLYKFLIFLQEWKREAGDESAKKFLTNKLFFDLQSMILGFLSIVSIKLKKFPQAPIKPAIVNQDCVENHFCQVRACNGQNNNPTYRLQESAQNSIRYGQTTISKKSNAGAAGLKRKSN